MNLNSDNKLFHTITYVILSYNSRYMYYLLLTNAYLLNREPSHLNITALDFLVPRDYIFFSEAYLLLYNILYTTIFITK